MSIRTPQIYLDNNATTHVADEVLEAMLPFLGDAFANPSSHYSAAGLVSNAIGRAREQVAGLLGADPSEVVFTSGGTESNNTALHAATVLRADRRHIITTAVEHPSVLNYCRHLEQQGYRVTYLPVDSTGRLAADQLESALDDDTAVVSIMTANNETGVLFDVEQLAGRVAERGVLFHTDAVQSVGKESVRAQRSAVDFLAVAGHKLHGPKGIGVLVVRRTHRLPPFLHGGDQERGRRAGTENVASIVGLGLAAEMADSGMEEAGARMRGLRDRLEEELQKQIPGLRVAGSGMPRLPNTSMVLLDKVESEPVLALLDMEGICCSSGSACTAGSTEPSHVLQAMGLTRSESQGAVRLSLSRYTTSTEVDAAICSLVKVVGRMSSHTPARVADATKGARIPRT